jgi:site-specific DNA recombinase
VPTVTKKGSRVYRYYVCSGAQKNGFESCPHPSMSAHKLEHLIVEQIRVIGQDKKLQAETMKQVRRATRERRASLGAEEKTLRSSREKVQAETNGLLKALADGTTNGPAISGRLSDLEEQAAKLNQRLAEIERERQAADESTLDPNDLASALSLFDPVWNVLFPSEQARIIELLIRQIEYNGKTDKLAITFHQTGIKALAGEVNQEVTP